MKTGIELITEERQRQIEKEGWNADHDANHTPGILAIAGACYAVYGIEIVSQTLGFPSPMAFGVRILDDEGDDLGDAFPFGKEWDKREKHDAERRLIIAGALIAAEIDKLRSEK